MKITKELYDNFDRYGKSVLDENGHEILDDRQMEIPLGFQRPPTLQEQIKKVLFQQLSEQASNQGMETLEESLDFSMEDDIDDAPLSGLQTQTMVPEEPLPTKNASEGSSKPDNEDIALENQDEAE